MGNQQNNKINVTHYDPQQWKILGTHRSIAQIVLSSKGKGQAEGQILHLDPKANLEKQIQIYQYRKNQDNALVKCVAVHMQKSQGNSLCGNNCIIRVLTQRIPLRLNQLPQLTFQQSVYVLTESLRGYKDCYNKLGPFEVTSQMIGVNNHGQIKVWVNQNFAQNHPITEKPLLFTSGTFSKDQSNVEDFNLKKDQSEMIRNVIGLVEQRCESGRFPLDFSDKINQKSSNFNQVFKEIESYVNLNKLFIPDKIINMNTVYSKGKYFTPGQQYTRNENDPLYRKRKPFLPQPQQPVIQPLQGGKFSNILIGQNEPQLPEPLNRNGRINSPILSLYPQEGPVHFEQGQRMLDYQRSQVKDLNSDVTFNVIRPEVSTLVFDGDSCLHPHQVFEWRV